MRPIAAFLVLLLLAFPLPASCAGETLEGIEGELETLLRELDAVGSELDRLGEIAAVPKATGVRIEIARGGDVPPPAAGRVLIDGKTGEDREWTRPERDGFAGGSHPLVFRIPLVPGTYAARIELSHPTWQAKAATDIRIAVRPGETAGYRFRLHPAPGKPSPTLAPDAGK